MALADAHAEPLYGVPYRLTIVLRSAAGAILTSWAAIDAQIMKDPDGGSGTWAALTGETEPGSNGIGYVDLSAADMTADVVVVRVTATNAIAFCAELRPKRVPHYGTVASAGTASSFTLASTAPAVAQLFRWQRIRVVRGTGIGQSSIITDYTAGRVVTVDPPFAVAPTTASVVMIEDSGMELATIAEVATETYDQADSIESGLTLRKTLRLIAAALGGEITGVGTNTITIRNAVADSKNRIVATVDANDNRLTVTTDLT